MRIGAAAAEETAGCADRPAGIEAGLTLLKWTMSPNPALSLAPIAGVFMG